MAEPKSFTFEVDPTSDVPLWVQLRQRLVYLITSGYFKPGDQLPTVRGLASDISINYNTVNKAYMSLVSEGYLESTRGRGVFVTGADAEEKAESNREIGHLVDDFISSCRALGLSLPEIQFMVSRRVLQLKREERGETIAAGDDELMGESESQGGKVLPLEGRFAGEGARGRGAGA